MPAHRLGLFAGPALGRLFVAAAKFHLTEHPLALHLLLQRAQGLIDVIVADQYVDDGSNSFNFKAPQGFRPGCRRRWVGTHVILPKTKGALYHKPLIQVKGDAVPLLPAPSAAY